LEDAILLKTERMRGLTIDPVERIARAEAGVLSLEVVRAAAKYGLTSLTGSSADVGVVGYALGGGLSFLGRKYGLAANNVRAIEIVTADGSLVRADRDHEPNLFWAARRPRQLRSRHGDRVGAFPDHPGGRGHPVVPDRTSP
jgi:FAD/FMN-containing dehydrogenase